MQKEKHQQWLLNGRDLPMMQWIRVQMKEVLSCFWLRVLCFYWFSRQSVDCARMFPRHSRDFSDVQLLNRIVPFESRDHLAFIACLISSAMSNLSPFTNSGIGRQAG